MPATNPWHFGHGELVMDRLLPITDSPFLLPPDQVKALVSKAGDDRVGCVQAVMLTAYTKSSKFI